MKWEGERESDNVEDGRSGGGGGGGGGFGFGGGRGIGIGGIAIALLASWAFGINPLTVLGLMQGGGGGMAPQQQQAPTPTSKPTDPSARFVSVILASTEDVWTEYFARSNQKYVAPHLHLFRGRTATACGAGQSATGPFYCPADQKVYIDLSFYETMKNQLGAPGDFAQAYVIAHEVGHHLQYLLGTSEKVDRYRQQHNEREGNAASVRLELQADCYAGVWAALSQEKKHWLEAGDVEEALNAATQIGDDTLQRKARGTVMPESFTHGSSEQRVRWFKRGMSSAKLKDCDTFNTTSL
ncbi:neutral zinc metallopeptidase [Pelomonas sp. KK5]|uniref:KPN_02809 family neutral zinc metallopeptidase n=1 Tax=Pelomonas sp. KK5 TaxID=1855730 RepID=UPI00097BEF97|nr:neutral zinc metallopeptidase [Pelomonas sp. KK5]